MTFSLSTTFDIASLTKVLYPLELPFCVVKLIEKGEGLEPSSLQVTLATLVLDFLEIFVVIYAITCICSLCPIYKIVLCQVYILLSNHFSLISVLVKSSGGTLQF